MLSSWRLSATICAFSPASCTFNSPSAFWSISSSAVAGGTPWTVVGAGGAVWAAGVVFAGVVGCWRMNSIRTDERGCFRGSGLVLMQSVGPNYHTAHGRRNHPGPALEQHPARSALLRADRYAGLS